MCSVCSSKNIRVNYIEVHYTSRTIMAQHDGLSSTSSSGSSSPNFEFSDSDSDRNDRGKSSSRPRRLPTSNSKNAVAARMNRMKQKQYVKDLEQRMSILKREMRVMKKELKEHEKKWINSCRQVAYLRGTINNSHQIGNILRNIRWKNIVPQGSNIDKTLNELNSDISIDHSANNSSSVLFEDAHAWSEQDLSSPIMAPQISPRVLGGRGMSNLGPSTSELFQESVPSKHVKMCTLST